MSSDRKSAVCPHPPRLCNVVRTPSFSGYGFNLHTIKNKTGQFIGQVDEGSPAEKALLKQGDRIVEVNGVNIASENHKQVVSRIKLVPNETTLLVVDEGGDKWYKERNIVINSDLPEVVLGSSAARRPSTSSSEGKPAPSEDRRSMASVSSASNSEASNRQEIQEKVAAVAATSAAVVDSDADSVAEVEAKVETNGDSKSVSSTSDDDKDVEEENVVAAAAVVTKEEVVSNGNHEDKAESSDSEESDDDEDETTANNLKNVPEEVVQEVATIKKVENEDRDSESGKSRSVSVSSASSRGSAGNSQGTNPVVDKSPVSVSPSPPSSVGAPSPTPAYNFPNVGGLNLNMTAAEMREMLASKKKKDIRNNTDIDLRKKYEIVQKL